MDTTREWLERLYGKSPGYFAVTVFAGGKGHKRPRAVKWFATSELDAAARSITVTSRRADVYVSVGTYNEVPEATEESPMPRGGENGVISIPGFWADLDIGELGHKPASLPTPVDEQGALSIIDGLPEPSLLAHSGGGLQAYWLFDEPWVFNEEVDRIQAKQAATEWQNLLVERGKNLGLHVDKIPSLDRIMRVPGTQNHKLEQPRPVEARRLDGPTEPVDSLAALGLPEDEILAQSSSEGVADTFPLTWEEILGPHGWTPCGEHKWARPGKKCSEGHSATTDPYGVPVLVNFSATDLLPAGAGQRLTKLKVWAHLNYGGDLKAAKQALHKMVKSTPDDWAKIAARFADARLDWSKIWTEEDSEPEWLVEPLLERGRQVAFYSDAKAGKSLVTLEMVLTLVFGEEWPRPRGKRVKVKDPISIVYVDQENTRQDIRMRAGKMGYEGEVPEHLHYYSFPSLAWLDTERGGEELHALARYHGADLVIIDTLSRVVEGEENDNDTANNFYKYTGVRLKADGIALLRLDHAGKDKAKGMRGGSAKTTDVDEVWQLLAEHEIVTLNRTHSRTHHGEDRVLLKRIDEPVLHHAPDSPEYQQTRDEDEAEVWLELEGIPAEMSPRAAWTTIGGKENARGYKWRQVEEAQKRRKARVSA